MVVKLLHGTLIDVHSVHGGSQHGSVSATNVAVAPMKFCGVDSALPIAAIFGLLIKVSKP